MYEGFTTDGYYKDDLISITNVGGIPGGDAFLIVTSQKSAIIDAGYSFSAEKMTRNIKNILGERRLDYAILTHSHYDHAAGAAYCRAHYRDCKIISSEYAAKIFSKPSAIDAMRETDRSAAEYYGWGDYEDRLDELKTDIIVREGDVIDLGGITLHVLDAPGHTKCCIAFYVPEEKMLIACETMGCFASKDLVLSSYLVGYQISVDFINRVKTMDIEKLLVPHFGVIKGEECRSYIEGALRSAVTLKDLIINDHLRGMPNNEIVEHYKEVYYNGDVRKIWPIKAFYLNAEHLVPMVIKEILG